MLHGSVFDRIAHGRAVEGQSGRVPYAPRQLPELTAAQLLQLKASKPVLLGVPPSCLLVPLTDGSGDVLMHTLTSAERDALLQSVHDDPLQVFQLLAQSGTEAMRAAVPPASLPPLLLDALHRARDSAASERLRILATAVESDINALLQTPWQESELRTVVRRVTGGFVDARQAVRWLAELERAHALVQRDATLVVQPDQGVGALVARLNSARSAPASELEPAIDALLDLYGASLDAWLGTTAPPAAVKMKAGPREFTAQRRNLNAITALAEGRYAAMSQALRPEAGVTALMNACDGVVASIDSRAELAQVSAVFAPTLPTADDVSRAIANLTRFMNRRDLPPAQEEAMRQAGGYLVESLVTAALRLKTAPA